MGHRLHLLPLRIRPGDDVIGRFMTWLSQTGRADVHSYDELWSWSVTDIEGFWSAIWEFFGVAEGAAPRPVLAGGDMPGCRWFPEATVSFAEHVFRASSDDRPALVAVAESGATTHWSWDRLGQETAAFAAHLRDQGVGPGDRVVGYLPNVPEAVVAFLAAASVGAVWSVCNLDVAVPGVLARFHQLEPTVLVAADCSHYGGRQHERRSAIVELRESLPSLRSTVIVGSGAPLPGTTRWADVVAADSELSFERVPFEHPLWVLFSSGTTGSPKGIVHGHGGVLLEQLMFLSLHLDLQAGDCFFWHCSTTWVMWNIVASALLTGATVVLYDGHPTYPDEDRLWQLAEDHAVTMLGCSPAYLMSSAKAGLAPRAQHDLRALRSVGSTGAPLPAATQEWVAREVGVPVNSMSGGTDVAGPFAAGNPLLDAPPGEMAARCLGVAAQAWDPAGQPVVDAVGELVVTKPMPSMPLGLWGDDGTRYRDTYFDVFPGVWRQGDWATITARGTVLIHGRSDATLNRHGVRMGSGEIYEAVESVPDVLESLVVGVELPDGGYWMPLFVHLAPDVQLDEDLLGRITAAIREHASPRHVPDDVIAVPGLPHTLTGKRLEVPVKRILQGRVAEDVVHLAAVDRPELLAAFEGLARTRVD
jgi:acetoacetyl-CoA synthetase